MLYQNTGMSSELACIAAICESLGQPVSITELYLLLHNYGEIRTIKDILRISEKIGLVLRVEAFSVSDIKTSAIAFKRPCRACLVYRSFDGSIKIFDPLLRSDTTYTTSLRELFLEFTLVPNFLDNIKKDIKEKENTKLWLLPNDVSVLSSYDEYRDNKVTCAIKRKMKRLHHTDNDTELYRKAISQRDANIEVVFSVINGQTLTLELLKKMHVALYRNVAPIGGLMRPCNFSRDGVPFVDFKRVNDLIHAWCNHFEKFRRGYSKQSSKTYLAMILSDFNAVHPFCDGNGTMLKVIVENLSRSTGFHIDFHEGDKSRIYRAFHIARTISIVPLVELLGGSVRRETGKE
ncbi:Fic family protein [Acidithiobacillus sulfuriphilus]|uniref:Fido domain-containing protein n=2 Tax=Acidithiobacillus sulfuriphilus TaxID=1867749 RepID=A0A3M8RXW7_9PROT|nr:Fic family protein [Acidithiobacillus sulfuriphilus]RNF71880.1 hypothetical protein EC580_01355 [Acidithiobacillus sulfuriphilus]